jgi:hypothetical protein
MNHSLRWAPWQNRAYIMVMRGYTVQSTRKPLYAKRMVKCFRWWWASVGIRFTRINVWLQYVQRYAWKSFAAYNAARRKYTSYTSSKETFTDTKWRPWYLATFVLNLTTHREVFTLSVCSFMLTERRFTEALIEDINTDKSVALNSLARQGYEMYKSDGLFGYTTSA